MAKPSGRPPGSTAPAKLRSYWTKVRQILIHVERLLFINARIHVVILQFVVACQRTEWCVCQFSPIRAKNRLQKQRPLRDREKKVRLIMSTHTSIYPENLVKISPVHYEIISLQ